MKSKKFGRIIIGYFLVFVYLVPTISQESKFSINYQFQHLTEEDGLANNRVHCGLLDSKGFMWFGTHDGLSRWDGIHVKNFHPNEEDSTSISGALVTGLLEDTNGYIWVINHQGDLCRYNTTTEDFETFPYPLFRDGRIIDAEICLYQDSEGILWIGTYSDGFIRFNPTTKEFKNFDLKEQLPSKDQWFQQNSVIAIIEDIENSNILWIGGNDGLYYFDKRTEKLFQTSLINKQNRGISIQSILMNHPDDLWLGTYGSGIIRYHKKTETWDFHVYNQAAWKQARKMYNVVISMEEKSPYEFWIASKDKGAGVFNTRTETFSFFEHQSDNAFSINDNAGYRLYRDSLGSVWFFMEKNGVNYIDPTFQQFSFYPFNNVELEDIVFWPKDFLYHDTTDQLSVIGYGRNGWVETDRNGQLLLSTTLDGYKQELQIYNDIHQTKDGSIWVAGNHVSGLRADTFSRPSLLLLNRATNELQPYESSNKKLETLQQKNILRILEIDQELWGITENTLFTLNPITEELQLHTLDKRIHITESFNDLIYHPSTNLLLIATENGLVGFNIKTQAFTNYKAINNTIVKSIVAQQDTIWLATSSKGIKGYHLKTAALIDLNSYNNTPKEPIDKVFLDTKNRLWSTTQKGLVYLDKPTKTFIHFDSKNGLNKDFFFKNGVYTMSTEELLLGQRDGFYRFHPERLLSAIQSKEAMITQVKVNDKVYPLSQVTSLNLAPNENSLYFSFSSLAFSHQQNIPFKYKLEGIDDNWINSTDNRNFAIYNKLPPGDYTFQVKTLFQQTDDAQQVVVSIATPFYQSTFAYLLYLAALIGITFAITQFLLNKKAIEKEAERLKELDQIKSRLYTNITHEFRTPLTVIQGMAQEMPAQTKGKSIVLKNTSQLLEMVNQMLSLSKLEHGIVKLDKQQSDIIPFLKYQTTSWTALAVNKSIDIAFHTEVDQLIMDYDAEKLEQVFNNLFSNSLKFTPQQGAIRLYVTKENNQLLLQIKDTGTGISAKQLPHIFNRFYQVDTSTTRKVEGTGIGLAVVKELILLMEGNIQVESTPYKGTTFNITLPINRKAPIQPSSFNKTLLPQIEEEQSTEELTTTTLPELLIIEDSKDIITYLKTILTSSYQIHVAHNGKEGISLASTLLPDIIICDVMMPEADGLEVTIFLKTEKSTCHIPIILLTAKATQEAKIKGLTHGADAYLTKPFDKQELLVRLEQLIAIRKKLHANFDKNLLLEKSRVIGLSEKDRSFLNQLTQFIKDNIADDSIDVQQMQQAVLLSRTQLYKKLKALTGLSTSQYRKKIRMEIAKELLENKPDLTASEIAYRVGYKHPSHFSRDFKQLYEQTPTGYRADNV